MSVENSANPVESSAELYVESETVHYYREPPPPYSLPDPEVQAPVTTQPDAQLNKDTVLLKLTLKNVPTFCKCFKCGHKGLSKVEYVNTNKTHLLAGCICGITRYALFYTLIVIIKTLSTYMCKCKATTCINIYQIVLS